MRLLLRLFLIFLSLPALCQVGGTRSYRFLDIPMTARAAALGGNVMPVWGNDINLLHSNPGLLNPSMQKQVALNYCNYIADINNWYVAHAHTFSGIGTTALSIQSFNYGKFAGYDELGQSSGTFKASDYAINLSIARPLADSMFNVGFTLKNIFSQYDRYSSAGTAGDLGIVWRDRNGFTASLLVKNVGVIWKTYSSGRRESLPNTVQFGVSKRVPKAPFRIIAVYDQLLHWNLRYISPIDTTGKNSTLGSTTPQDSTSWQKFSHRFGGQADNFFRHVNLGVEILVTNNFNLRVAYNYRRQKEMTLPEKRGINALSFGVGFRIKRFGISYAFSKYAVPTSSNTIGLTFAW